MSRRSTTARISARTNSYQVSAHEDAVSLFDRDANRRGGTSTPFASCSAVARRCSPESSARISALPSGRPSAKYTVLTLFILSSNLATGVDSSGTLAPVGSLSKLLNLLNA